MSILINAQYESIKSPDVSATLTSNRTQAWSLSGWFRPTNATTGANNNFLLGIMTHAFNSWDGIIEDSNNFTVSRLKDKYSYTALSSNLPTDANWYYAAICCAGNSSADDLKAYIWNASGTLVSSATTTTESGNAFTPNYFQFGAGANFGDIVSAYWAYGRAWIGVQLSQAEFEAERPSPTVVKTSNIWTAFGADSVTDITGNSRNWTLDNGTVESGVNPTLPSGSLILPHRSGGGFLDLQGNFRG